MANAEKRTTKRWSAKVKTISTYPPKGLFTRDPETIARTLASEKVSPKGPGSGMKMLNFFINRAGKNLSALRKAKLQKAKDLLSERVRAAHERKGQLLSSRVELSAATNTHSGVKACEKTNLRMELCAK